MSFVVVRHLETGGVGAVSEGAVESLLANGWVQVSEPRPEPSDFHLPDFANTPELAPPQPDAPAAPEEDEE